MTYLVDDKCVLCKHKDCVEVCPVDCFYEGENTLVINPDECIDCGVCEPECPVEAIWADTDSSKDPSELAYWLQYNNADFIEKNNWPVITDNDDPMPEHEKYHPDNFPEGKKHLFSEKAMPPGGSD